MPKGGGGIARREVPLGPFRDAFAASGGLTVRQAANRLGYDWSYTRRLLVEGAYVYNYRRGKRYRCHLHAVSYEKALLLADALDLDPVDVGL